MNSALSTRPNWDLWELNECHSMSSSDETNSLAQNLCH